MTSDSKSPNAMDFSVYDSLIVASALMAGCKTLYSEYLQHGQFIDGRLVIQNPFATE
jgi:predicted nucleic acid-binding protein